MSFMSLWFVITSIRLSEHLVDSLNELLECSGIFRAISVLNHI